MGRGNESNEQRQGSEETDPTKYLEQLGAKEARKKANKEANKTAMAKKVKVKDGKLKLVLKPSSITTRKPKGTHKVAQMHEHEQRITHEAMRSGDDADRDENVQNTNAMEHTHDAIEHTDNAMKHTINAHDISTQDGHEAQDDDHEVSSDDQQGHEVLDDDQQVDNDDHEVPQTRHEAPADEQQWQQVSSLKSKQIAQLKAQVAALEKEKQQILNRAKAAAAAKPRPAPLTSKTWNVASLTVQDARVSLNQCQNFLITQRQHLSDQQEAFRRVKQEQAAVVSRWEAHLKDLEHQMHITESEHKSLSGKLKRAQEKEALSNKSANRQHNTTQHKSANKQQRYDDAMRHSDDGDESLDSQPPPDMDDDPISDEVEVDLDAASTSSAERRRRSFEEAKQAADREIALKRQKRSLQQQHPYQWQAPPYGEAYPPPPPLPPPGTWHQETAYGYYQQPQWASGYQQVRMHVNTDMCDDEYCDHDNSDCYAYACAKRQASIARVHRMHQPTDDKSASRQQPSNDNRTQQQPIPDTANQQQNTVTANQQTVPTVQQTENHTVAAVANTVVAVNNGQTLQQQTTVPIGTYVRPTMKVGLPQLPKFSGNPNQDKHIQYADRWFDDLLQWAAWTNYNIIDALKHYTEGIARNWVELVIARKDPNKVLRTDPTKWEGLVEAIKADFIATFCPDKPRRVAKAKEQLLAFTITQEPGESVHRYYVRFLTKALEADMVPNDNDDDQTALCIVFRHGLLEQFREEAVTDNDGQPFVKLDALLNHVSALESKKDERKKINSERSAKGAAAVNGNDRTFNDRSGQNPRNKRTDKPRGFNNRQRSTQSQYNTGHTPNQGINKPFRSQGGYGGRSGGRSGGYGGRGGRGAGRGSKPFTHKPWHEIPPWKRRIVSVLMHKRAVSDIGEGITHVNKYFTAVPGCCICFGKDHKADTCPSYTNYWKEGGVNRPDYDEPRLPK